MTEEIIPTNGTSAEDVAYAKKVKEIYIDGVNVWSCKHYDLENNYCDQSYLGEGGLLKNTKNPKRCECSPNCYYKQLKRLEQKRDKLKKKLGTKEVQLANAEFDLHFEEMKTRELGQANKELIEDNLNLSKENIKLKENAQDTYDMYKALIESFEISNNERSKYKSALEEIKTILLEHSCADSHTTKYITDKINECLGG